MTHTAIARGRRGKGLRGRAARQRKQQLGALTKPQAQVLHDLPASGRRAAA